MKSAQSPDTAGATLRVAETEDGRWTWCYCEPGNDLTLYSNETFASREAAMDWAKRAYPEVPFAEESD
ncbi:MAG TPA: hypothetical protein VKA30_00710 [Actinomycetota bacterium]|nr:hypothetical protein [Actinomycetota bacterium]